jgi:hypothetical protein
MLAYQYLFGYVGPYSEYCSYQDGGGFGEGSGTSDPTYILSVSNNAFVGVTIQYRVASL